MRYILLFYGALFTLARPRMTAAPRAKMPQAARGCSAGACAVHHRPLCTAQFHLAGKATVRGGTITKRLAGIRKGRRNVCAHHRCSVSHGVGSVRVGERGNVCSSMPGKQK